jgi:hypothetical protein
MSEKKRIYLSGYEKLKLKKEAEDAVSKLTKSTHFFETINSANEITNTLDFSDLIQKFSELKSRKKTVVLNSKSCTFFYYSH